MESPFSKVRGVGPTPIGVPCTLVTLSYVLSSEYVLRVLHVYILIVRLAMVCVCALKKEY